MKIKKYYSQNLSRLLTGCLLFICCAVVSAQTQPAPPTESANQISADENFELNIAQKRITENGFARSTSVNLINHDRGGLHVEVGVGVRAESIDLMMRGIFGRVRFRASLESLRQKIERFNSPPLTDKSQ